MGRLVNLSILFLIFFPISHSIANEIKVIAPDFSSHEFDAIIEINSTTPLAGAQCNFLFNESILNATYVKNGGMFEIWGGNFSNIPVIDNRNGTIKDIIAFSIKNATTHGNFALIHFKAIKEGKSFLNIENALLSDENANKVNTKILNATITIDFTPPKIENVSINVAKGNANISCQIIEPYIQFVKINITYPNGDKKEFYMNGNNLYFFNSSFPNGNYSFYIIAKDKAGNMVNSPPYKFSIGKNNPPVKPYSPMPSNASTGINLTTTLSWKCCDADNDTITYDIYFGTNSNPPKVASNITSNSYNPTLDYGKTYYWKVVAWDEHGAKNEGSIWHFTTIFQKYTLTTHVNPSNAGYITLSPSYSIYDAGSIVIATAHVNEGYTFDHWGGDVSGNDATISITMNGDKNIIAYFKHSNAPPTVTITSPLNGSTVNGTIKIHGTASDDKSVVKVEIEIDDGPWRIANGTTSWSYIIDTKLLTNGIHVIKARSYDGSLYGYDSIRVDVENEQVKKYTITTHVFPSNAGYITLSPSYSIYDAGSVVITTAHANNGYTFDHWGGDVSGSSTTISITMNGDKNIIAYFGEITPPPPSPPPSIDFSYNPSFPFAGEKVYFYGKGNADSWHWEFGDGSFSYGKSVSHIFRKAGKYKIILEATINGKNYEKEKTIEIRGKEKASFYYKPSHPSPGMIVYFYGKGKNITKYEWEFGDGSFSYGKNASHVYTVGTYNVTLHIVDKWGNKDNKSIEIKIQYPDFVVENLKYSNGIAKAILSNLGGDAKNVSVAFYLNEKKIKETKLNFSYGKEIEIEEEIPHKKGKNEIKVVIDPQNDFKEGNEENNVFAIAIGKQPFSFLFYLAIIMAAILMVGSAASRLLLKKRKARIPIAEEKQELRCTVCLGKFKPNSDVVRCECGAVFHKSCAERVKVCPICGRKLV